MISKATWFQQGSDTAYVQHIGNKQHNEGKAFVQTMIFDFIEECFGD